jgi:isopenicillin N synthase-like dioxygenase
MKSFRFQQKGASMTKFADVPLIDLAALARGGADATHEMLVIERACAREGFFTFRDNAGVPARLVQQNFELDRILWGAPAGQLATLATDPSRDLSGRGIETKGARTLDVRTEKGKNDLNMSFGWTREFTANEAQEFEVRCKDVMGVVPAWLGDFVHKPNRWPAWLPGFADTKLKLVEACRDPMRLFCGALERVAGCPRGEILGMIEAYNVRARSNAYPPVTGDIQEGQQRAGKHTDFGLLTFLFTGGPGLMIQEKGSAPPDDPLEGLWSPVPHIPGTVIGNIGDALMLKYGLPSTRHCVTAVAENAHELRQSIALFLNADWWVSVQPGVYAGEALLSRLNTAYRFAQPPADQLS